MRFSHGYAISFIDTKFSRMANIPSCTMLQVLYGNIKMQDHYDPAHLLYTSVKH